MLLFGVIYNFSENVLVLLLLLVVVLGDVGVDGRIILKLILRKMGCEVVGLIHLIRNWMQCFVEHGNGPLRSILGGGFLD
jgi:hypothetical protein